MAHRNKGDELDLEAGQRIASLLGAAEIKALRAIMEAAEVGLPDVTNEQLGIAPGVMALLQLRGLVRSSPSPRRRSEAIYQLTPDGVAACLALRRRQP
jgi:DNA-binding MarR family transcriptional regulator